MQTFTRGLVACGIGCLLTVGVGVVVGVAAVGPAAAQDGGGDRALTDRDAVLRPAADGLVRSLGSVQGCQVLLDAGIGDCAVVNTAHGALVVTVESGPYQDDVLVSRPWTVRVYRPVDADAEQWQVALETAIDASGAGPLYANVTAEVADITGDGDDELLLGYRSEGTGQILDVDVVDTARDGTPRVLAHDQLYKGTAIVRQGRLVTYEPVYREADANCCPTWIERSTVRFREGALRVVAGSRMRTAEADVPAGDLG
jgi:hypothetical protein